VRRFELADSRAGAAVVVVVAFSSSSASACELYRVCSSFAGVWVLALVNSRCWARGEVVPARTSGLLPSHHRLHPYLDLET